MCVPCLAGLSRRGKKKASKVPTMGLWRDLNDAETAVGEGLSWFARPWAVLLPFSLPRPANGSARHVG